MIQSEFNFTGEQLRDFGMQLAIDHADQVHPSPQWSIQAYNVFVDYVKQLMPLQTFMTEDVRQWAFNNKRIPEPPSNRAWGSISIKVCKSGLIEKAGYASVSNAKAHCTPATLWRKI